MKVTEQKFYKAKEKYIPIYINKQLYNELFGEYESFEKAQEKLSDMFSLTITPNENFVGSGMCAGIDNNARQTFFYNGFNIKGGLVDKSVQKESDNCNFYPMKSGIKEAVTSEILYNLSDVKPFRTLCILDTNSFFDYKEKILYEDGSVLEASTVVKNCIEVRYSSNNGLERYPQFICMDTYNVEDDLYKNMASFEAFKFINKFLQGSLTLENLSINGTPTNFDTASFLKEYSPLYSVSNDKKECFFGFEHLCAEKLLEKIDKNNVNNFKKEYYEKSLKYFSNQIGLDESYIDDDLKTLFDLFLKLSQATLVSSTQMNVHHKKCNKLGYYNFSKFFRKILLDYNKKRGLVLLLNDTSVNKDTSESSCNIRNFFDEKDDPFNDGIEFINAYFKVFDKTEITKEIIYKAYKLNVPKTSLLTKNYTFSNLCYLYDIETINTEQLNNLIELCIKNGLNEIFNLKITNAGFYFSEINGDTYKIKFFPFKSIGKAIVIAKKYNEELKKYEHDGTIVYESNDIKIKNDSFKILIDDKYFI